MRPRRIREDSVPKPADQVRQTSPQTSLVKDSVCPRHRAIVLRQTRGQDAHRDPHQGHVAERRHIQLALHVHTVMQVVHF